MIRLLQGRILALSALFFILAACNLQNQAEITAEPTLDVPTVEILAPSNNRQIIEGVVFDFDLLGRDESIGIARIALYVDEQFVGEAEPVEFETVPLFRATINWLAQGQGRHLVEAIAYRPDGTRSDSAQIIIEVLPRE